MSEISINKFLLKGGMKMIVELMKDRVGMINYLVHRGYHKDWFEFRDLIDIQSEFCEQLEKDRIKEHKENGKTLCF